MNSLYRRCTDHWLIAGYANMKMHPREADEEICTCLGDYCTTHLENPEEWIRPRIPHEQNAGTRPDWIIQMTCMSTNNVPRCQSPSTILFMQKRLFIMDLTGDLTYHIGTRAYSRKWKWVLMFQILLFLFQRRRRIHIFIVTRISCCPLAVLWFICLFGF